MSFIKTVFDFCLVRQGHTEDVSGFMHPSLFEGAACFVHSKAVGFSSIAAFCPAPLAATSTAAGAAATANGNS